MHIDLVEAIVMVASFLLFSEPWQCTSLTPVFFSYLNINFIFFIHCFSNRATYAVSGDGLQLNKEAPPVSNTLSLEKTDRECVRKNNLAEDLI